MLNQVILCLGSNRDPEKNIRHADALLRRYFTRSFYSEPVYTDPVGTDAPGPFLNQVVIGYTSDESSEKLHVILKQMEKQLGRTPDDKKRGRIPIDIDLLQWNAQILKPGDLQREYVISGLSSLLPIDQDKERSQP